MDLSRLRPALWITALAAGVWAGTDVRSVEQGHPLSLPLGGAPFSEIRIDTALEPGPAVHSWKKRAAAARDSGGQLPDRLTVAVATFNYSDGTTFDLNLRCGESVGAGRRDWWNPVDGFIYHLPFARILSAEPVEAGGLIYDVRYRTQIINPHPDKPVASILLSPAAGLEGGRLQLYGEHHLAGPTAPARFVSTAGSDENPGTFLKPWKTLNHAAASIRPGETVYVRGGHYKPERRILFRDLKAAADQPTRIIGWPGESAVFDFIDCHWDPDADRAGSEHAPQSMSMIHLYACEHALVKNLHLIQSRARGFGAEACRGVELSYNFVFRTYGPGIRFIDNRDSRLIGNCLIRPTYIGMGPSQLEDAGSAPVAFQTGDTMFIEATKRTYMAAINAKQGERSRKPPNEGIDSGRLRNVEFAYNEISWGDKELMLVDGDVDGLRIHHNYLHDACNLPWASGIAPNGYGEQQNIEIDHNIVMRVAGPLGVGTEGGGFGKNMRFHHNITVSNAWNCVSVTGAWGDRDADLSQILIYSNTSVNDGHLDSNTGPAGAFPISFPSGQGKVGRTVKGVVEDITIENNLVVGPRDYVVALVNPRDLEDCRIQINGNVTDLQQPGAIFDLERNADWKPVHDVGIRIVAGPLLRDPAAYDFRATEAAGSAGAFGPGARWVEVQ